MTKNGFSITKELKEHEKRYTTILVIVFVFVFLFVGYYILSIDNKELNKLNKTVNYRYSSLSNSSQLVTLTNENILTDIEGLKTNKINIHLKNTTDNKYEYQIVLRKDEVQTRICGCEKNIEDYKYIKYSLNGKDVLKLDKDMVVYKGSLKKDGENDISLSIWLDKTLDVVNYHYHGYFSIEEINQD